MNMTMTLEHNGTPIITYSANTWWIAWLNPEYLNVQASDLTATFSVTFQDAGMFMRFVVKNTWVGITMGLLPTTSFDGGEPL